MDSQALSKKLLQNCHLLLLFSIFEIGSMYIEGAIKDNGYYMCVSVYSYIAGRNSCRPTMYVGFL